MDDKFEELLKRNQRKSNLSKVMGDNEDIDPCLLDDVEKMYNTCIKPTVRKNYKKLITKE